MSSCKLFMGHSLTDGSGRDTYIKLRPDSKAFVKPTKKLAVGPERRARPNTEYRDVFVPETASKPYVPTALSYTQMKMMAGLSQKLGDKARFTIRRSDVLRRDAEESARLLKLHRQNITVDPMQTLARNKLQRTFLPVLQRGESLPFKPSPLQCDASPGEVTSGPFPSSEQAVITLKPRSSATSAPDAALREYLDQLNQEAMRTNARTSRVLQENASAGTWRVKMADGSPVQLDAADISMSALHGRKVSSAAGTERESAGKRTRRSAMMSSNNAPIAIATDGQVPIRSSSAMQVFSCPPLLLRPYPVRIWPPRMYVVNDRIIHVLGCTDIRFRCHRTRPCAAPGWRRSSLRFCLERTTALRNEWQNCISAPEEDASAPPQYRPRGW